MIAKHTPGPWPDLLEAAERLLNAIVAHRQHPWNDTTKRLDAVLFEKEVAEEELRTAIAKAKGETPSIREQKPPLFQFKYINDIRPGMLEAHYDGFKAVIYSSIGTTRAIVSYSFAGGEMGGLHGYFGSQEEAMEWCERKAAMIISERKGGRV